MAIDNIVLYGRCTPNIEDTLTTKSVYFGPKDSVYVYSPNGHLMVTLVNQGTHDYGCTSIQIDRTGTSAQALRPGHTPPQYVTDKTFRITPTTGSTTNPYTIYLHYTSAEQAGWENATGNTWSVQAYVVKTAGSTSAEYSAATPTYTMDGVATGTLAGGGLGQGELYGLFRVCGGGAAAPLQNAGASLCRKPRRSPLLCGESLLRPLTHLVRRRGGGASSLECGGTAHLADAGGSPTRRLA